VALGTALGVGLGVAAALGQLGHWELITVRGRNDRLAYALFDVAYVLFGCS